jgi:hypothetical protein
MLLRCESLEPPMSQLGQMLKRGIGDLQLGRCSIRLSYGTEESFSQALPCCEIIGTSQELPAEGAADLPHLVGAAGQGQQDGDAERLGGLEVQKQFRFTSPRDARAPNAL